jgi:hypothetical protein
MEIDPVSKSYVLYNTGQWTPKIPTMLLLLHFLIFSGHYANYMYCGKSMSLWRFACCEVLFLFLSPCIKSLNNTEHAFFLHFEFQNFKMQKVASDQFLKSVRTEVSRRIQISWWCSIPLTLLFDWTLEKGISCFIKIRGPCILCYFLKVLWSFSYLFCLLSFLCNSWGK